MRDPLGKAVSLGALATVTLGYTAPAGAEVDHDVFQRQTTETDGLAVSGGLGNQYVMLGAQVSYYFQVPRSLFRVAPWVAVGAALRAEDDGESVAIPGTAGGVSGSWGHQHRLTVNALYGPGGFSAVSLHGEEPDVRLEWGPALTVGYEYMGFNGFFVRADAGVQVIVTSPIMPLEQQFRPAITLVGLGYKLW